MKQTVRTAVYDESLQIEAYRLQGTQRPFPNHFHGYYVIGLVESGTRRLSCRQLFSGRVPFFCSILGIATPVLSVGRRCWTTRHVTFPLSGWKFWQKTF